MVFRSWSHTESSTFFLAQFCNFEGDIYLVVGVDLLCMSFTALNGADSLRIDNCSFLPSYLPNENSQNHRVQLGCVCDQNDVLGHWCGFIPTEKGLSIALTCLVDLD